MRGEGPGGTLSGTFAYDDDDGRLVTTHTDAAGAVTATRSPPGPRWRR